MAPRAGNICVVSGMTVDPGQHPAQQHGQGVVGVGFSLMRHRFATAEALSGMNGYRSEDSALLASLRSPPRLSSAPRIAMADFYLKSAIRRSRLQQCCYTVIRSEGDDLGLLAYLMATGLGDVLSVISNAMSQSGASGCTNMATSLLPPP